LSIGPAFAEQPKTPLIEELPLSSVFGSEGQPPSIIVISPEKDAAEESTTSTTSTLLVSTTSSQPVIWPPATPGSSLPPSPLPEPEATSSTTALAVLPPDTTPPPAITDLAATTGTERGSVVLSWSSPSDDTAEYELRFSQSLIGPDVASVSTTSLGYISWSDLASSSILIQHATGSSVQIYTLGGLSYGTTSYVALKAKDVAGNISELSNIASATSSDMPGPIVFNEIAWAGWGAADNEWIELYNRTDQPIDLTGWRIEAGKGGPDITFGINGSSSNLVIAPQSYFLLERTDDNTVPTVAADWIGPFSGEGGSGLNNDCESLELFDNASRSIDRVDCGSGGGWFAGGTVDFGWGRGIEAWIPMERVSADWPSSDPQNWDSIVMWPHLYSGTPKAQNLTSQYKYIGTNYIYTDTHLTKDKFARTYLFDGLDVYGKLEIDSGVKIALLTGNMQSLKIIGGQLLAPGTITEPVVIDSINGFGGLGVVSFESNAQATASNLILKGFGSYTLYELGTGPSPHLIINNSSVNFDNLQIIGANDVGLISITNSNAHLANTTLNGGVSIQEYSTCGSPGCGTGYGVSVANSNLNLSNSTIKNIARGPALYLLNSTASLETVTFEGSKIGLQAVGSNFISTSSLIFLNNGQDTDPLDLLGSG